MMVEALVAVTWVVMLLLGGFLAYAVLIKKRPLRRPLGDPSFLEANSDTPELAASKRRVRFLLALTDSLAGRGLTPQEAIQVSIDWLKSPDTARGMTMKDLVEAGRGDDFDYEDVES